MKVLNADQMSDCIPSPCILVCVCISWSVCFWLMNPSFFNFFFLLLKSLLFDLKDKHMSSFQSFVVNETILFFIVFWAKGFGEMRHTYVCVFGTLRTHLWLGNRKEKPKVSCFFVAILRAIF